MFGRLCDLVLGHRALSALLLAICVVASLAGATRLRADFSALAFYGSEDPEVARVTEWKNVWGKDDAMVLVVVDATTPEPGGLLTGPRLRALDALLNTLLDDPGVRSAEGLTGTASLRGDTPGTLNLSPIIDRLPEDEAEVPAFAARLREDPLLVPFLLSAQGDATAIVVELDTDPDDIEALRPAMLGLRAVLETWEATVGAPLGLRVGTAGIPAVRTDFFQLILEDQKVTVPLLMLVLGIMLLLIFRRIHGLAAPAVAALVPTFMVFGLMGWRGEPIGILNQSYFTLLPVIAVADAIHMVSRFHEEVRARVSPGETPDAATRRAAIRTAMAAIGKACFLTSLTTAVGFGSLMSARMPILRGFGGYAALGVVLAYATVLLILPLLLSLSRGPVPEAGRVGAATPLDRLLAACARWSTDRPWSVVAITVAVVAGSCFFATRVVVDNVLTGLVAEDHPTRAAGIVADRSLGGILAAEVDLRGPAGTLDAPEVLAAMTRIEAWAMEQEGVRAALSPARWLAVLGEALTGARAVPTTRAAVAQFTLLGEGDPRRERLINSDASRARLSIRLQDAGGNAFEAFATRLQATVERELAGTAVTGHVTGTPFVAYRGINAVTSDLRDSLMLAFVMISGIIGVLFRSLRVAVIALIPNLLPLLVGYGLMGLLGWDLDPTPAVVFTIALGIAVDDTIHLMVRFREERTAGRDVRDAIHTSVLHSGRAVLLTSVLLCVGFGLNALSAFPSMRVLGALGASVIFVALLADLFVLPALLMLDGRRRGLA